MHRSFSLQIHSIRPVNPDTNASFIESDKIMCAAEPFPTRLTTLLGYHPSMISSMTLARSGLDNVCIWILR